MGRSSLRSYAVVDTPAVIRYFLALLLLAFVLMAQAETVPAIEGDRVHWVLNDTFRGSKEAACHYHFEVTRGGTSVWYGWEYGSVSDGYNSDGSWGCNSTAYGVGVKGWSAPGYSCPDSSYTLSGTICSRSTCTSTQIRNSSGGCEEDCGPKAGPVMPMFCQVDSPTSTSCSGTVTAQGGCPFKCSSVAFNNKTSGDSLVLYPASAMGSACRMTGQQPTEADKSKSGIALTDSERLDFANNEPPKDPTPSKCAAMGSDFFQTSSGVKVCAGTDLNVVKAVEKSTVSGPSDGAGGVNSSAPGATTKTDSTSCTGANCTTTSTTESNPDTVKNGTTNGGCASGETLTGGKCVTTSAKTEAATDYCTKNPLEAVCKKTVLSECEKSPNTAGCSELGTPTDSTGVLQSKSIGVSTLTPVSFASVASCPADLPLPYNLSLSFEPACRAAGWIRPLVLALAWLSAGMIVIGAAKSS